VNKFHHSTILNAWLYCFFGFVVIHPPAFNTYVIRGSKGEYLRGGGQIYDGKKIKVLECPEMPRNAIIFFCFRRVFSIGCQHYLLLMLAADAEVASAAASSASKI
jgi:hypothetical protein